MVVGVASTEGIDKGPERLADDGWAVDGADVCSPGALTGGPEPVVVVGVTTLLIEAVAEVPGWGAVAVAFTGLTLAPFAGWC